LRENWFYHNIKEGLGFIVGNRQVYIILAVIAVAHFFIGSLPVVLPFLAGKLSGAGIKNLGYLETTLGAGMILGALLTSRKKMSAVKGRFLFLLVSGAGVGIAAVGAIDHIGVKSVVPYLAAVLLLGMMIAQASVYWQSLLQVNTPNEMAGRVFSISATIGNTSLPMAFAVFGILMNYFSLAPLLIICGLVLIVFSGALLFAYRREGSV